MNWALAYPWYTDNVLNKAICWPTGYKYLASIYWAFTTISTIGFGDIRPVNTFEQVDARESACVRTRGGLRLYCAFCRLTDCRHSRGL